MLLAGLARAEVVQLADIRRTVETKDESGKVRRYEEPIEANKSDDEAENPAIAVKTARTLIATISSTKVNPRLRRFMDGMLRAAGEAVWESRRVVWGGR